MTLPKWATTVTPFSKILALIIFIIFPIIGFVLGIQYQRVTSQLKIEYITIEKIMKIPQEDTARNLIKRCGKIPDEVSIKKDHYDMINGPSWSPDCRHIAWSLWESGTSYLGDDPEILKEIENNPRQLSGKEGVFLFTDAIKTTMKIYVPKKLNEMPVYKEWLDRNVIVFTADKNEFNYNLTNNSITLIKKLN